MNFVNFRKIINPIVILTLLVIITTACSGKTFFKNSKRNTISPFIGDIDESVEETGIVVFDDEYLITSNLNAKIIESYFVEGDEVKEGQLLYSLDDINLRNQIEQVSISLEKANEAYRQSTNAANDLIVTSYASGMVAELYCHEGDYVSIGSRIADIVDLNNLILKVPFNSSDKKNLYIGACAEITMSLDGSILYGTIDSIYDSTQSFAGGRSGVIVEIAVLNPGALKEGDSAFAKVGNIVSMSSGEFSNKTKQSIFATQSGQVQSLLIAEGDSINKGMQVMIIKNDSITNGVKNTSLQIKEIQSQLSQLKNTLSDYQILSPIDGVVTKKLSKESDYAVPNNPLAIIADLGNLYVDTDIDELYIKRISLGQVANLSLQGSHDRLYHGSVTKIDDVGVAKNGVTYYTVRIKLNDFDNLMVAMNVDVKIRTNSKQDVLLIPIKAVSNGKVNILQDNKVIENKVTMGIQDKEYVEIIDGLNIDDKIILGGNNK